jgi:HAE1 family hydrophobic/amphiphilic exporter-1
MTAFAFILGVVPLMLATGAGAASRQSIGTTVFGGMLAATILTLVFVPVFYAVIERLRERGGRKHEAAMALDDYAASSAKPAE